MLAQALDLIKKNPERFTRPADAYRDRLVLTDPPTGNKHTEATRGMREVHAAATFADAADERVPLSGTSVTRSQHSGSALH